MRKFNLLITLFLAIISNELFAQIPNAGFENWTGNEPDSWDNLNSLTSPFIYTCTKGTPGNPGASYLKLTTKNIPVIGLVQGIALSGKLDKTTFQPKSGFPFNQRPTALTGNWQYVPSGIDQGFIVIAFTKWNSVTNNRDTISITLYLLEGSVTNWESFSIPITFTNPSNPDTCLIVLSASSLTSPAANSYLSIDNLSFSFINDIKENINTVNTFKTYPNPVTSKLQIEIPVTVNPASISYKIINNMGQIIQSGILLNRSIETSLLPKGFYFIVIESNGKQYQGKFIKQ